MTTSDRARVVVPVGRYCEGRAYANGTTVMFLALGADRPSMEAFVGQVALAQMASAGFRPVFVTDLAAPEVFRGYGYRFEYIVPRERWLASGHHLRYDRYLRTRMGALAATYEPQRTFVFDGPLVHAWQDLLALGCALPAVSDSGGEVARKKITDLRKQVARLKRRLAKAEQLLEYEQMCRRLRDLIVQTTPPGALVCVVSRGDESLVDLPGREGWHFPRTPQGVYAGVHPADSEEALRHLEELRGLGAQYLVIPHTERWWLDHYDAWAEALWVCHSVHAHREGTGTVVELATADLASPADRAVGAISPGEGAGEAEVAP